MKEPTKIVEPKVEPKYTAQSFFAEYNALCEKSGFQIVVQPSYISSGHGTFETSLQVSVGATKK